MTPIAVRATVTFHPRVGPLTLEVFGCASADDGSHVHDGFCQKYHHCEKGEGGQGSPPCLTMNESNTLFNRVGRMFSSAFTYGNERDNRFHYGSGEAAGYRAQSSEDTTRRATFNTTASDARALTSSGD